MGVTIRKDYEKKSTDELIELRSNSGTLDCAEILISRILEERRQVQVDNKNSAALEATRQSARWTMVSAIGTCAAAIVSAIAAVVKC